ncbi:MAG: NAD-dependent epimerase/dehydratase family protein [Blastocatellia bacterium]
MPMVRLLEACRRRGRQPLVLHAGTVTQTGFSARLPVDETHPDNPMTVYDLHKQMAENYLKYYAGQGIVRGVALRLANVYGPGPGSSSAERGLLNIMVRRALAGEPLTIYGEGDYLRDFVYVDDVVDAFLMAGAGLDAHPDRLNGRHFVVGSGRGSTIADSIRLVADRVARKTARRVPVIHVAPPKPPLPIEARDFVADPRGIAAATGWRARVSLAEGIDHTIEYYRAGVVRHS